MSPSTADDILSNISCPGHATGTTPSSPGSDQNSARRIARRLACEIPVPPGAELLFLLPAASWIGDAVVVIGWGTRVKIAAIRTDLSQGLNGIQRSITTSSYEKNVDIVGSFQTGYLISGIAPFGDLLVVLAYNPGG